MSVMECGDLGPGHGQAASAHLIVDGAEHPVMDRQVLLAYLLRRDHDFPYGATGADCPIMRGFTFTFLLMRNITVLFPMHGPAERRSREAAHPAHAGRR
jgi:hypothetical protein